MALAPSSSLDTPQSNSSHTTSSTDLRYLLKPFSLRQLRHSQPLVSLSGASSNLSVPVPAVRFSQARPLHFEARSRAVTGAPIDSEKQN